jgi:phospholipase/carboxylesterase
MRRFFRRISDGVFDQENIKDESFKMKRFIESLITTHNLSVSNCYFLGYSNGANMILACLFYYPELIKNMLLLHPMLPFVPHQDMFTLSSHKAFLSYGKHDTMISLDETEKVINNLKSIDIKLTVKEYPFGHEISQKEFEDLIAYLIT